MSRTNLRLSVLVTLAVFMLAACGLTPQPPASYGSGGQNALPDPALSMSGMAMSRHGPPTGVDRNGGGLEP